MIKHTPATPLPWKPRQKPHDIGYQIATDAGFEDAITGGIRLKRDAVYIAHVANAYPRLVKVLCDTIEDAERELYAAGSDQVAQHPVLAAKNRRNGQRCALLHELGEDV